MNNINQKIINHWQYCANIEAIDRDFKNKCLNKNILNFKKLAVHDQLHSGKLEGTEIFFKWINVLPHCNILDIGSGLGGVSRMLAVLTKSKIIAVELSPKLSQTAFDLTKRFDLCDHINHVCADFLSDDFNIDQKFNLILINHVDMQIFDKHTLYKKLANFLYINNTSKQKSKIVWHDWLAGSKGLPDYPIFWSKDGSISFLQTKDKFESSLKKAGLQLTRFEEKNNLTLSWYSDSITKISKIIKKIQESSMPAANDNLKLKNLENLKIELTNAYTSIIEKRLVPFFGEAVLAKQF